MAKIVVAEIDEADAGAFINLMKGQHGNEQREAEDDLVFAKRVYQAEVDKRVVRQKADDYRASYAQAQSVFETQYRKDNPPPEGVELEAVKP